MKRVFKTNPQLCVGCRLCELMCSLKKAGQFNPYLARLKIVEDLERGLYLPVICRHCRVPKCQEVCPTDALPFHPTLPGVVVLKEERCIGCLECVTACPFGAIRVGPQGQVLKCDLCDGEPVCVQFCYRTPAQSSPSLPYPPGTALEYTEFHKVNELRIMKQMEKRRG